MRVDEGNSVRFRRRFTGDLHKGLGDRETAR
jgi:hypothetical protein